MTEFQRYAGFFKCGGINIVFPCTKIQRPVLLHMDWKGGSFPRSTIPGWHAVHTPDTFFSSHSIFANHNSHQNQYLSMKKPHLILIFLAIAALALAAGCTDRDTAPEKTAMEMTAEELVTSIDAGLMELRGAVGENAQALAVTGLSGPGAEEVLGETLLDYPWAVSSLVITKEGVVVAAAPKNDEEIIGMDLSYQPQVQKANTEQVPIVSDVFVMAEGFTGISQSQPVFSAKGEYLGYTDITYKPEDLIERCIAPVITGTDYDVWVAQVDGTVIYDTTKEEIGKNLLSDPAYADPALQEIFGRILAEPSGSGEYTFWDKNWNRNVTKTAAWETAGIDSAEWRVVVTRVEGQGTAAPETTGDGSATAGVPATSSGIDTRYSGLEQFVKDAAAYAREHGREAALKEFNNPDGAFIDGELYIFAYEMDGTVIALPYQQGLIGAERTGVADANGVEFIDAMIGIAREGGGSVYYIYPNPEADLRDQFKLSYVVPVDDDWFVGAGIYLPEIPAGFDDAERDQLVKRVKDARDYAQKVGKEQAVADFNDLSGEYAAGSRYIFAYDYQGTCLALPFQPEYIGTNRMDFADTYGVEVVKWEIATAQRGGGFVYVQYFNPDTGEPGMKLCYVTPVDDEWFVGSGMYTEAVE